jgi:hypothetical protein
MLADFPQHANLQVTLEPQTRTVKNRRRVQFNLRLFATLALTSCFSDSHLLVKSAP